MSRPLEIVASYTQGKSFAHPHSTLDFLAMAYDELLDRMRQTEREMGKVRAAYQSTIEDRANDMLCGHDLEVLPPPPSRPGVWSVALKPIAFEWHHMSAHPTKWDVEFAEATARKAGDMIARKLFDMMKTQTIER